MSYPEGALYISCIQTLAFGSELYRSSGDLMGKHLHRYLILLLCLILYIVSFETELLRTQLLLGDIMRSGINYDAFREMKVSAVTLEQGQHRMAKLLRRYPELKNGTYINPIGYLTFSMLANDFQTGNKVPKGSKAFLRCMGRLSETHDFKELYGYYKAIFSDLCFFPVPQVPTGEADISYTDTWYVLRKYGGNRRHEGTDLMASNNEPGYFPVVSMTDGIVEKLGWLEQGGYRIGIRGASGAYFYYAHLDSYAAGLKEGDPVIAGQLLGFMGDTGYGPEGTRGKFDVHLHLGIYVVTDHGEMSVNPYWILRLLEGNRGRYCLES